MTRIGTRSGASRDLMLVLRVVGCAPDVTHGERRLLACPANGHPRYADADAGMLTVAAEAGAGDFPGCRHGRWRRGDMRRARSRSGRLQRCRRGLCRPYRSGSSGEVVIEQSGAGSGRVIACEQRPAFLERLSEGGTSSRSERHDRPGDRCPGAADQPAWWAGHATTLVPRLTSHPPSGFDDQGDALRRAQSHRRAALDRQAATAPGARQRRCSADPADDPLDANSRRRGRSRSLGEVTDRWQPEGARTPGTLAPGVDVATCWL